MGKGKPCTEIPTKKKQSEVVGERRNGDHRIIKRVLNKCVNLIIGKVNGERIGIKGNGRGQELKRTYSKNKEIRKENREMVWNNN